MATITKKDLIDRIAEQESCKRVLVKRIIQCFLDTIVHQMHKTAGCSADPAPRLEAAIC